METIEMVPLVVPETLPLEIDLETELVKFRGEFEQIKDLDLAVPENYDAVHSFLKRVRKPRIAIEAKRKELGADARKFINGVNELAKRLRKPFDELEEPMLAIKKNFDAEQERIAREKAEAERKFQEKISNTMSELKTLGGRIPVMSVQDVEDMVSSLQGCDYSWANEAAPQIERVRDEVVANMMVALKDKKELAELRRKQEEEKAEAKDMLEVERRIAQVNKEIADCLIGAVSCKNSAEIKVLIDKVDRMYANTDFNWDGGDSKESTAENYRQGRISLLEMFNKKKEEEKEAAEEEEKAKDKLEKEKRIAEDNKTAESVHDVKERAVEVLSSYTSTRAMAETLLEKIIAGDVPGIFWKN